MSTTQAAPLLYCSDGGTGIEIAEIDDNSMSVIIHHNVPWIDIVVNKSKTVKPVQFSFYVRKYKVSVKRGMSSSSGE